MHAQHCSLRLHHHLSQAQAPFQSAQKLVGANFDGDFLQQKHLKQRILKNLANQVQVIQSDPNVGVGKVDSPDVFVFKDGEGLIQQRKFGAVEKIDPAFQQFGEFDDGGCGEQIEGEIDQFPGTLEDVLVLLEQIHKVSIVQSALTQNHGGNVGVYPQNVEILLKKGLAESVRGEVDVSELVVGSEDVQQFVELKLRGETILYRNASQPRPNLDLQDGNQPPHCLEKVQIELLAHLIIEKVYKAPLEVGGVDHFPEQLIPALLQYNSPVNLQAFIMHDESGHSELEFEILEHLNVLEGEVLSLRQQSLFSD